MILKIAHLDIPVLPMTGQASSDSRANGLYNPNQQTIQLSSAMSPQEQARVLIHEIIHACYDGFDLVDRKRGEEEVCEALDGPLATVFRDNPEVLGVLHQALCNGKPIV